MLRPTTLPTVTVTPAEPERMECRHHGEPEVVFYDRSLEGVE